MTEYVKVKEKGQVTLPTIIRKILKLDKNSLIGFKITPTGIVLVSAKVVEQKIPYTKDEWAKIEAISGEKGKTHKTAKSAKNHLKSL